ncbi:MAG TPA: amidohydrolase [Streptosporangiaceae bacterium]|nr:amidohydrolase [Streptosporangiaceae bacterium]
MGKQADVVFTGGAVYTADPARRAVVRAGDGLPASAVAVRGDRIVAVGDTADIEDLAGPRTKVVDLRGRALLPGFQDAHVHPAWAGVTMVGCNLIGSATLDEALARIGAYADAHRDKEWIAGSGWRMEWFEHGTPGRELLDQVTGGRPAYLTNRDGHGAWVSTRALELAGIDARSPDPPDGRIERGAGGSPQGTLHEGAATLVGRLVPPVSLGDRVAGLMAAQQHLHARGITAWQDAIIGDYLGSGDPLPVYLAAARAGTLTARVEGALWWDRGRGAEQLPEILARRELGQAGRFRANTVKIMQDGVAESFTAGMIEPYLDACGCQTGNRGLSHVEAAQLREYVTRLDAAGFQVHLHAIGDRAVREALDAIEAARQANGASDHRHHIAHLQVMHPDDVPRFAALGVTANVQALWAAHEPQMDDLTIPFIGPERAARQYLFGDLLRSGARLAAGSDWAVSSANPLRAIHVAVNRRLPGAAAEPLLPAQSLSLGQALAAYTAGSAYVNHLDETGAIGPGLLADLVVLDRDPFDGPPDEIASTSVALTYVGGEQVYAATR